MDKKTQEFIKECKERIKILDGQIPGAEAYLKRLQDERDFFNALVECLEEFSRD